MKAAVYYENGPPEVLRYEDVPDPVCEPSGIVIRVEAVSIEGGDTLNRAGGALATKPHIVGYQAAGEIIEVGREVRGLGVGDKVVTVHPFGSHAERRAVPARNAWRIPAGADVRAAAAGPIPFGTADECLFEFGRLRSGETVLVQAGASGVGLAAIQLAKRAGATVIATASSADKLERLREFGMDHGIDYRRQDLVVEAKRITGGRGVNVVVDPVGTTLEQSLAALAYRGRVSLVGRAGRGATTVDASVLMAGNQSLTGVFLGAEIVTDRVHDMIQRHVDDVAKGALRAVVDSTFPLREAAAAHRHIESRAAFGRVLLIP
jgi:NADPH2:quinone reductase